MVDSKITLFSHSGFTHMLLNMESKISPIIKLTKEEYKSYRNRGKDGIKLMFTYFQMKHIFIINRMMIRVMKKEEWKSRKMNKILNWKSE